MQDLTAWLNEHGFKFVPVLDGNIHRFVPEGRKDPSGWYQGSIKEGVTTITVDDWATGERLYFRSGGFKNGDLERWKNETAVAQKKQDDERRIKNEETAKEAQRLFNSAGPAQPNHPYIKRKRVQTTDGIRQIQDTLLIPMQDTNGKIWGIQKIWPDGQKRFLNGQRKSGLYFRFQRPEKTNRLFVCEGFATADSIFACSCDDVVVAFDAGNLQRVCEALRMAEPNIQIIVAGDDDKGKDRNIGRIKAQEGAESVLGIAIFPDFHGYSGVKDASGKLIAAPTDWNDLYILEGENEVKAQIQKAIGTDNHREAPGGVVVPAERSGHSKVDGGPGAMVLHTPPIHLPFNSGSGEGGSKPKKERKKGPSQEEIDALGREILDCRFKLFVDNQTTILYNITDIEKKEVVICENDDILLRRLKTNIQEKTGKVPDEYFTQKVYRSWKLVTTALKEQPKSFTWANEDEWSFRKLDFVPEEGDYPAWKEFLNRLSSPEDFMAWVWSVFEMKNTSRQILYLHDPAGETGKSTVIKTLGWVFGNSFSSLNNTMVSGAGSRWLLAQIFGKRLIAWADCKNPKFVMSETARNISSGDPVPIEFKGGHPFQATMYAKLIIGSNHEPQITGGGADTSRLMVIGVAENNINKDDPNWWERLQSELPYFLYRCSLIYEDKCPKHGKISLSNETMTRVWEATEGFETKWEDIIARNIEFGPEMQSNVEEWMRLCRDERLDNHEMGNLKDYLKRKPGVFIGRRREHGSEKKMKYSGFRIRGCSRDLPW